MDKKLFANYFNPEKVEEIIKNTKKECAYSEMFRFIKHSANRPLTKEDFYPTIMEYNRPPFTMPSHERQKKYDYTRFSTSCSDTIENLKALIETVPTMKNCPQSCIAKGHTDERLGFADEADHSNFGHIHYFLYDPCSFSEDTFDIIESVSEHD